MSYNLNFPGKDDKGWSMYIDRQRSWFMHGSVHEQRSEGGIQPGSTVGVLLDLDRHQLSFYVNEEPQVCAASHIKHKPNSDTAELDKCHSTTAGKQECKLNGHDTTIIHHIVIKKCVV
jgi:hypothetical protein